MVQVWSLDWEDPWRRKWQPTPVFLSGKSHGQRSMVSHSPWRRKESDTTKRLLFLSVDGYLGCFRVLANVNSAACNAGDLGSILGGGHGNPLQYSCLENPHWQRSLAGYSPWGRKRVGHDWVTKHSISNYTKPNN